uniref:Candidate secreted effector n=1 Tax=Meloidogyne incognita TaxID=6306 RepID=A0A914NPY7_MELIC
MGRISSTNCKFYINFQFIIGFFISYVFIIIYSIIRFICILRTIRVKWNLIMISIITVWKKQGI